MFLLADKMGNQSIAWVKRFGVKKDDVFIKNFEYGILNFLFLGVAFSFFFFVNPQFIASSSNRKQLTEKVYAKVFEIRGKAYVLGKDSDIWVPITRGDYILLGDYVVSAKSSEVVLEMHRTRKKHVLNPDHMFFVNENQLEEVSNPSLAMFSIKKQTDVTSNLVPVFDLGEALPVSHKELRLEVESIEGLSAKDLQESETKKDLEIHSYYKRQEEIRYWALTDFELAEGIEFVETKLYFAWDQWMAEKQDVLWRVQVSEYPDFSKIVYEEDLGNSSEISLSLYPGDWFVRASARRRYSNNEYVGGAVLFKVRSLKEKNPEPEIRLAKKPKTKKTPKKKRSIASFEDLQPYDLNVSEYSEKLYYLDWKVNSFEVSSYHYQLDCEDRGRDSEQAYLGQNYHYVWKELTEGCSYKVRTRLPNWSPWSEYRKISL